MSCGKDKKLRSRKYFVEEQIRGVFAECGKLEKEMLFLAEIRRGAEIRREFQKEKKNEDEEYVFRGAFKKYKYFEEI